MTPDQATELIKLLQTMDRGFTIIEGCAIIITTFFVVKQLSKIQEEIEKFRKSQTGDK